MRIALLSDIHALADCYRQAIAAAQAEGFDRLVVMGDLLSYGCQIDETLELTDRLVADHDAVVLRGNHDQLYCDLARGDSAYLDGRPYWIVETANWTMARLAGIDLEARYAWQDKVVFGDLLVSHANPFGPGDWTYIRDDETARRASEALAAQGLAFGVFGHVHRQRRYAFAGLPVVATVGSIGQPRESGGAPAWAMLTIDADGVRVESRRLAFDLAAHRQGLKNSGMTAVTVGRLLEFFA